MALFRYLVLVILCIACTKPESDSLKDDDSQIRATSTHLSKPVSKLVAISMHEAQELIYSHENTLTNLNKGFSFIKYETCTGTSDLGNFNSRLEREFTVIDFNPNLKEIKFYVKTILNRSGGICAINTSEYMGDEEYILSVYIPSATEATGMVGDMENFFQSEDKSGKFVIFKGAEDVASSLYGNYQKKHEYGLNLNIPYPASVYVEQTMEAQAYAIKANVKIFSQILAPKLINSRILKNLDHYYEGDRVNSRILDQVLELTNR